MTVNGVIAIVVAYLLGSIPSAYIAGRLVKGIDIRQVGGRNVGALNTMREIGTAAGVAVLIADIAKGLIAVLIARWLEPSLLFIFIAGFAAVVGHNWSIFLGFKGGKGAATTMGVLLALAPGAFAISFGIIVIFVLITSNFILAMGIGLALLPLILWLFNESGMLIAYSLALPLFCSIRYIPTLKRALASVSDKKDLVIDKQYHFWQTRKSK